MTAYTTSTNTTFVDTYTISGTSTILNATSTATQYTSTSIVGVVGSGGGGILIIIAAIVILIGIGYMTTHGRRRR